MARERKKCPSEMWRTWLIIIINYISIKNTNELIYFPLLLLLLLLPPPPEPVVPKAFGVPKVLRPPPKVFTPTPKAFVCPAPPNKGVVGVGEAPNPGTCCAGVLNKPGVAN